MHVCVYLCIRIHIHITYIHTGRMRALREHRPRLLPRRVRAQHTKRRRVSIRGGAPGTLRAVRGSGTPVVVGLFCFCTSSLFSYTRSLLTLACKPQHFRDGCGGAETPGPALAAGQCVQCVDCGTGNWRQHCATPVFNPGECLPCQDCGAGRFLTGCAYLEPGTCSDCYICSAEEYMVTDCDKTTNRLCAPCTALPACPIGNYRQGCGSGSEGQCVPCQKIGRAHV